LNVKRFLDDLSSFSLKFGGVLFLLSLRTLTAPPGTYPGGGRVAGELGRVSGASTPEKQKARKRLTRNYLSTIIASLTGGAYQ
jgi:hypothetical protein